MKLKSLFSLLLVVLVHTGCTSSTTCSDDTCGEGTVCNASTGLCELADDTGETTESETTSCVTDADCDDATQRCDNGTCVSKCDGVTCNEAAGEICDPTTGLCVGGSGGCNLDEDCGDGQVCEEGLCVGGRYAGCDGQNPCSSKLSCRYGIGFSFCVEACESHDSCFPNEACTPPDLPGFQDFAGHCFWNACAPGGGMNNNMQNREWLERCDVAEPGDNAGICYGPIFNGTENFAWCLAQRGGAALESLAHNKLDKAMMTHVPRAYAPMEQTSAPRSVALTMVSPAVSRVIPPATLRSLLMAFATQRLRILRAWVNHAL